MRCFSSNGVLGGLFRASRKPRMKRRGLFATNTPAFTTQDRNTTRLHNTSLYNIEQVGLNPDLFRRLTSMPALQDIDVRKKNAQLLRVVRCKEEFGEYHPAHTDLEAAQRPYCRRRSSKWRRWRRETGRTGRRSRTRNSRKARRIAERRILVYHLRRGSSSPAFEELSQVEARRSQLKPTTGCGV